MRAQQNLAVLVAFLSIRVHTLPSPEPQADPTTRLCQLNLTPQVGSPWADCQNKCLRDTFGNIGSAPTYTQCAQEAGCYGDCALDPPPPEALPGWNRLCVPHAPGDYTHPFQDCRGSCLFPPSSPAYTPDLCMAVYGCYGECTLESGSLPVTEEARKQASRLCDPKNSAPWNQCLDSCPHGENAQRCLFEKGCFGYCDFEVLQ
ncbi:hypothetical protein MMC22_009303 [Lobaria immixta]|nr:hypothetical protein [Lobaria immixta]